MTYTVKETFYSLQGEGAQTGRPAVFCRFAGCNLWSGEEKHRAAAECNFCDTEFVGADGLGGGKFKTAQALADALNGYWPHSSSSLGKPYVVFTGGEPLLQLDSALIDAMHEHGFEVAVETNGTLAAPDNIDWLCVSPKGQTTLVQTVGNELKLVYPQAGVEPNQFVGLAFDHFYLQPLAPLSGALDENKQACLDYCLENPIWKLSQQTHKTLGIR
ncbi:MAG: 7-carboxy-7-deazaguanine synthase [Arenicellales bacterium]